MPWSGVELAEVASWQPGAGAVVGDYIVALNFNSGSSPSGALLPIGSFTVFHVPSETSRAFSGLSGRIYSADSVVALGSYAYVRAQASSGTNRDFRQVDPATGAVTILNTTAAASSAIGVAASGRIVYVVNTMIESFTTLGARTGATLPTSATGIAEHGGNVYVSGGGNVYVYDAVSLTLLATHVTAGVAGAGVGVAIGDRIYWASNAAGVLFFDTVTHAWGTYAAVSGELMDQSLVLGADGWLYGLVSTGTMAAVNPATGDRVDDTLPTSLTRPGKLFSAGGHIWRPYGDPIS